ncbi:MAG: hypothetical protein R3A52_23825 [Polyangiales bacterium]
MRAALALSLVLCASSARAVPLLDTFGGRMGYGEHRLPTGRGLSERVDLPPPLDAGPGFLRGSRPPLLSIAWVNTNGTVSFSDPFSGRPSSFPFTGPPLFAPWWSDIDTTNGDGITQNAIYWHVDAQRLVVTWLDVESSARDGLRVSAQFTWSTRPGCRWPDESVEFRYARCEWGFDDTAVSVGWNAVVSYLSLDVVRASDGGLRRPCDSTNVPGGTAGLWRFSLRGSGGPFKGEDTCRCNDCPGGEVCLADGGCGDLPCGAVRCPDGERCARGVCAPVDAGVDASTDATPDMDVATPTSPPAGRLVSGGCSCRARPPSRGGIAIAWLVLLWAARRTSVRGRRSVTP